MTTDIKYRINTGRQIRRNALAQMRFWQEIDKVIENSPVGWRFALGSDDKNQLSLYTGPKIEAHNIEGLTAARRIYTEMFGKWADELDMVGTYGETKGYILYSCTLEKGIIPKNLPNPTIRLEEEMYIIKRITKSLNMTCEVIEQTMEAYTYSSLQCKRNNT